MNNYGWECPKCGACYSPFVNECARCCSKMEDQQKEMATKVIRHGDFTPRTLKVLSIMRVLTLGQLAAHSRDWLLTYKGCGPVMLEEMERVLKAYSMAFAWTEAEK